MKNLYHWTIPKSSKMHSISQVFSSHPKGTHLGHPTVSLTVASPPGGLSNTSRLKWNIGISELKKRWFFNQNWSLRILRIMIDRSNVLSSFLEWLWKLQSREVFWTFTSCSHAAVQNSLKLWCHFFACFNSLAGKKHKFYPLRREETNTGNPYDNAQHVDLHATSCKFKKWDQTRDQWIIV